MAYCKNGCYGDCYAARTAKIYGYDFSKTTLRDFEDVAHLESIKSQIRRINMPFIRMGTNGDPSENWDHTLNICEKLQDEKQASLFPVDVKEIVIITKHWTEITEDQIERMKRLKICVNTSISALDDRAMLDKSIAQHERLKPFCRSVLRVVTCNFNIENEEGRRLSVVQDEITRGIRYINTVFRPSKNNKYVIDGVVNVERKRFIKGLQLMSKMKSTTYTGKCETCQDMCGIKTCKGYGND